MRDVLAITLDHPDRDHLAGDVLRGVVHTRHDEPRVCKRLVVRLGWHTEGSGNPAGEVMAEAELATDALPAGTHQHPFAFTLPPGPFSFSGHHMHVVWTVEAHIVGQGIRLGRDEKALEVFQLTAPAPDQPIPDASWMYASDVTSGRTNRYMAYLGATVGALFLIMGALPFVIPTDMLGPSASSQQFSLVMGGLCVVIGLVSLAYAAHWYLGRAVFRRFEITASPRLTPGDTLEASVVLEPSRAMYLNNVTARLICEELVVVGSGKHQRAFRHQYIDAPLTLCADTSLSAGEARALPFRAPLPEHAPPSFHAHSNELSWRLEITADIARWPDRREIAPLTVLPAPATRGAW